MRFLKHFEVLRRRSVATTDAAPTVVFRIVGAFIYLRFVKGSGYAYLLSKNSTLPSDAGKTRSRPAGGELRAERSAG